MTDKQYRDFINAGFVPRYDNALTFLGFEYKLPKPGGHRGGWILGKTHMSYLLGVSDASDDYTGPIIVGLVEADLDRFLCSHTPEVWKSLLVGIENEAGLGALATSIGDKLSVPVRVWRGLNWEYF